MEGGGEVPRGWPGRKSCRGGEAEWGASSGLCQPNAFFLPVGIEPPLEDSFPQDHTEDLKTQIPKEPSQLDQPGTGDQDGSEVSQKPNAEKDIHPGKTCRLFSTK